ncbi:hypothetical protein F4561_006363 [Lipingzhangella halophila]|uniref:DUF4352 domain-containing protein n=1 Tax=Lipingzhangella halophila TaxID=1783352 RepID=A0A7W7RNW6_9ACTN|nr:hypothetical protein [Lipingzhangella halophila]MBB4935469.1 hypothetical protein [Lipingzhangella halophila]
MAEPPPSDADPAPGQPPPPSQTRRPPPAWVWPLVSGAVALLLGVVIGWFGHQAYMINQIERTFGDMGEDITEEDPELDQDEPDPDPSQETATLQVGDTADVEDEFGDSYTLTVDDVRYADEVTGTAWEEGDEDPVFVTDPQDSLFAIVDLTITNNGPEELMGLQFGQYVDEDGTATQGEMVQDSGVEDYHDILPEDLGSDAPGEDLMPNMDYLPPDTTVQAVDVAVVAEDAGYLYGADSTAWRIELPPRD